MTAEYVFRTLKQIILTLTWRIAALESGSGGGSAITALTGDVTASGPGSSSATIAGDAVTNAKLANMAADTIKGRADGAGTGDPQDLTANQVSTILDTATDPFLRTSAAGSGGITQLTGDVTAGPGSGSQVATIPNDTVTYAKMQNVSAASRLLGRGDSGSGDVQEISLGTGLSMSGTTLNGSSSVSDGDKGDITVSSSGSVWTIDNTVVTLAKIQNASASSKLIGSGSSGSGASYSEISLGSNLSMSGTTLNATGGGGGGIVSASGFYLDDGSSKWAPVYPVTKPVDSNYAWINQGSSTVNTNGGGLFLQAVGAATNWRIRKMTGTDVVAMFIPQILQGTNNRVGICWRQSSDGKLVIANLSWSGGPGNVKLELDKWNGPTSFSATYLDQSSFLSYGAPYCFKFQVTGGNRVFSVSMDGGLNFKQMHSVSSSDFMTADEIGFCADDGAGITLLSWT